MIETGYAMPHWPRPWGRDAGAVEQLVIEQELAAAGVHRPQYGITGWVILTLIQHGTATRSSAGSCLPCARRSSGASSSASPTPGATPLAIKPRGPPAVDGGWVVNGQKVWTSGAQLAGFGLRHRAHRSRRAQAPGHHDRGHRHARRRASRCARCA